MSTHHVHPSKLTNPYAVIVAIVACAAAVAGFALTMQATQGYSTDAGQLYLGGVLFGVGFLSGLAAMVLGGIRWILKAQGSEGGDGA